MDERFVSLAALVRGAVQAPVAAAKPMPEAMLDGASASGDPAADFAHAGVVHEFALMRLAAIEAFERSSVRLLEMLASDVLARELVLSPVDLTALVKRALATFAEHEPVALSVAPVDAHRVHAALPVRVDPSLSAGDLLVDVRDGSFESQFALRLEHALEHAARTAE